MSTIYTLAILGMVVYIVLWFLALISAEVQEKLDPDNW